MASLGVEEVGVLPTGLVAVKTTRQKPLKEEGFERVDYRGGGSMVPEA